VDINAICSLLSIGSFFKKLAELLNWPPLNLFLPELLPIPLRVEKTHSPSLYLS